MIEIQEEKQEDGAVRFTAVLSDGKTYCVAINGATGGRAQELARISLEKRQKMIDGIWPYGDAGKPANAPSFNSLGALA